MTEIRVFQPETTTPAGNSELERVLEAWNSATERLQKTHEALRDEVRRLTEELEVKNRELARKNRLMDLGQMASHVAHEVRNGLAPVTLYLSLLRRRLQDDSIASDIIGKVEAGCTGLQAIVTDLLNFTSDRDPHYSRFAFAALLDEICEALAPQLAAQQIALDIDAPGGLQLLADRNMIRRAILNLLLNSLDAMPAGGELVITALEGPAGFEVEVADSGKGIDRSLKDRIFEPFVTTKSEGTGLGLAIVHRIAEVHGGSVEAINCPEGGAAITLRIPPRAWENAA